MKKRTFILFLIAILVISLSACEEAGPAAGGSTQATEKSLLTAAEAEEIALKDAGLTADKVTGLKTEFDAGEKEYDVEFHADGWEYDYEIHAETGAILSKEKEAEAAPDGPNAALPTGGAEDPVAPGPDELVTEPVVTEATGPAPVDPTEPVAPTAPETPGITEVTMISPEDAEALALLHADLVGEQISFQRTEYDAEDGVYEVEFSAKGWEYDYEVHAVTGEILSCNKEQEEDAQVDAPAAGITADEAKTIALEHAGVNAADARFEKAEYDVDDGKAVYEIEFTAGGYEYDYEIDADTGAILSSDKDLND